MRKGILIAAAVVALFGAVVAAISTSQHLRIQRNGLETASFCAISEKINCDIVNASSYSQFLGVPVAWWGFAYYALLAGMALFSAFAKDARATATLAWIISLGGILYSAWLASIAAFVLGVVCVECLAMYAANVALVVLLFIALRIPLRAVLRFLIDYAKAAFGRASSLGFAPRLAKHAIVIAAVFLTAFLAMKAIEAKGKGEEGSVTLDEKVKAHYLQSLYAIEPDPTWAVWGNPNAKVTIVEYSDFQCPFCRVAGFNLKPFLQEFKDRVRLYFVHFPLDNACNPDMDRPMHPFSCMAAKASICAGKRGDFWSFHDDLFRSQQKLSAETILALAEKRGWDRDEFQACIDSPEVDAQVKEDIASGRKIYVTGTPTIFIDNRKLKYWRDHDFLQRIVKEELRRSKQQAKPQAKE